MQFWQPCGRSLSELRKLFSVSGKNHEPFRCFYPFSFLKHTLRQENAVLTILMKYFRSRFERFLPIFQKKTLWCLQNVWIPNFSFEQLDCKFDKPVEKFTLIVRKFSLRSKCFLTVFWAREPWKGGNYLSNSPKLSSCRPFFSACGCLKLPNFFKNWT